MCPRESTNLGKQWLNAIKRWVNVNWIFIFSAEYFLVQGKHKKIHVCSLQTRYKSKLFFININCLYVSLVNHCSRISKENSTSWTALVLLLLKGLFFLFERLRLKLLFNLCRWTPFTIVTTVCSRSRCFALVSLILF